MKNPMQFEKDIANLKLTVVREFDAPVDLVWKAWTVSEILDKWWAPKPYRNETVSMDFREGGRWLYSMISPKGERHYCRADYIEIKPETFFSYIDCFCDEKGNATSELPNMNWNNHFEQSGDVTRVRIYIKFKSKENLEEIIKMGFQEGFTMGMDNLDEYLASVQSK
ncbi:ATPase [Chitinophaga caeni]|uniref:ATPase n=1 Tax=Chitinophaga caeni TaxID=2029983 RepID=A0A291QY57_9BACT|nr:SRPBCC domain-containing protein [Chitinophaga caeni]ATL48878.1 ATPase [Chitinophaga caeni]